MSTYPVFTQQGIENAVNYLLSGPAGLGQNFSGYSTSNIAYMTGNVIAPFTTTVITLSCNYVFGSPTQLTVSSSSNLIVGMLVSAPGIPLNTYITVISGTTITLSNSTYGDISGNVNFTYPSYVQQVIPLASGTSATMLDGYTSVFTFGSTQSTPPFQLGAPLIATGVTIGGVSSKYNQTYTPIGVTSCTTTTVTVKTVNSISPLLANGVILLTVLTVTVETVNSISPLLANGVGGTVETTASALYSADLNYLSTDCLANAVTTGPTDRVYLSGSLAYNTLMYTYGSTATKNCANTVSINRYKLIIVANGNSVNSLDPVYQYQFDQTIATIYRPYTVNTDNSKLYYDEFFTSYIDNPPPGAYEYRIDLAFNSYDSNYSVVQVQLGNRSLSAQVVKQ